MFVHKYQPCPVSISLDYAGPLVSVAVIIVAIIAVVYCCVLQEHLADFTLENRLTCLNTKFQKRKRKLWTYTYTNNAKGQIDNILMNEKWNNSALNCEAYSSFEGVSPDHRIVTAKIWLNLWRNVARTIPTIHYYWFLLNKRDISNKHTLTIFTNPSARAGYDTRSIFKRSLTSFNSEFSFS